MSEEFLELNDQTHILLLDQIEIYRDRSVGAFSTAGWKIQSAGKYEEPTEGEDLAGQGSAKKSTTQTDLSTKGKKL